MFLIALAAGLAAAVAVAPCAAYALAAAHLRFPFPRIFDRVVMLMLLGALILWSRSLGLRPLLRDAFAAPRSHIIELLIGLALAIASITLLFAAALVVRYAPVAPGALLMRAAKDLLPALLIAVIEEAFFRALLLGGMERDFGTTGALLASAAVYAAAHVVRAPAHYYLTGFHPAAGLRDLAASAVQLAHPTAAAPVMLGLFLLGLVLGEAFALTRRVYFPIGLHAGFVLGAKTWPLIARSAAPVPRWLAGPAPFALIAAPAAWLVAVGLMLLLPLIAGRTRAAMAD